MSQPIQPVNYLAALQQPDLTQGFAQLGATIGGIRDRQQQQALAQQFALDFELASASGAPTAFTDLIAKYPQQAKTLSALSANLSEEQRDSEFDEGLRIYSAMNSDMELAKQLVDERLLAMKNSGLDTTTLGQVRELMDTDPVKARGVLALGLSGTNPDKWSKIAGEERLGGLAPSALMAAKAKGHQAVTEAGKAVTEAGKAVTEAGKAVTQAQIAKEDLKIAALKAASFKEHDDAKLEKLNLEIEETERKRDQDLADRKGSYVEGKNAVDTLINTVDQILATPNDVMRAALGPIDEFFFTVQTDVADFQSLVEALGSQVFLAKIPVLRGTGTISNVEGDKLEASMGSLSMRQSVGQFMSNLKEIQRLSLKSRGVLEHKYKDVDKSDLGEDGTPITAADTPSVEISPQEINDLVKKYSSPNSLQSL